MNLYIKLIMDIKITNSMTLALHKNFLCVFIKHYGIGIEIADERMLATDNETYRIGCCKLDRREIDRILPSVDYIACQRIPFTNKIIHASFNGYY